MHLLLAATFAEKTFVNCVNGKAAQLASYFHHYQSTSECFREAVEDINSFLALQFPLNNAYVNDVWDRALTHHLLPTLTMETHEKPSQYIRMLGAIIRVADNNGWPVLHEAATAKFLDMTPDLYQKGQGVDLSAMQKEYLQVLGFVGKNVKKLTHLWERSVNGLPNSQTAFRLELNAFNDRLMAVAEMPEISQPF